MIGFGLFLFAALILIGGAIFLFIKGRQDGILQTQILDYLYVKGKEVSQIDIMNRFDIGPRKLESTLGPLENRGLISDDTQTICLTNFGKQYYKMRYRAND